MNKLKAFFAAVCFIAILLSLCPFSFAATEFTVEKNGVVYEVDKKDSTVSDGKYVYTYTFRKTSSGYSLNITYPNGSAYYQTKSGYSISSGWSDDYDPDNYTSGDVLSEIIASGSDKSHGRSGKIFAIIFLLILGIFNVSSPQTAWYISYGWRSKMLSRQILPFCLAA